MNTRRARSRHCRDARVYGRTTTAMLDNEYTPLPAMVVGVESRIDGVQRPVTCTRFRGSSGDDTARYSYLVPCSNNKPNIFILSCHFRFVSYGQRINASTSAPPYCFDTTKRRIEKKMVQIVTFVAALAVFLCRRPRVSWRFLLRPWSTLRMSTTKQLYTETWQLA